MNIAQNLKELMAAWDTIAAAAKQQFPNVSTEELYQIVKGAMNHALKLAA